MSGGRLDGHLHGAPIATVGALLIRRMTRAPEGASVAGLAALRVVP